MIENRNVFQNFLSDLNILDSNGNIPDSFISTPIISQNNNYNSCFQSNNLISPSCNTNNDESNIYTNSTYINANSIAYYYNHNNIQTPEMNFDLDSSIRKEINKKINLFI